MGLLDRYLLQGNAGAQAWQIMHADLSLAIRPWNWGTYSFNFSGICFTLVCQWLLEIKCTRRFPDAILYTA
jgi:hypothetical protein